MEKLKKLEMLKNALRITEKEIETEKRNSFESLLALAKREKISEMIFNLTK